MHAFGVCCDTSPLRWSCSQDQFRWGNCKSCSTKSPLHSAVMAGQECFDRNRTSPQVVDRQSSGPLLLCQSPREQLKGRPRNIHRCDARGEHGRRAICWSVVLACTLGGGCTTLRGPAVPAQFVGRWEGAKDGATLEMTDTGIFIVELRDGTTLPGGCSFIGQRVTMRYQIGVPSCPQEPGEYTFSVDGTTLTTSDPSDTCVERRELMAQYWNRVSK